MEVAVGAMVEEPAAPKVAVTEGVLMAGVVVAEAREADRAGAAMVAVMAEASGWVEEAMAEESEEAEVKEGMTEGVTVEVAAVVIGVALAAALAAVMMVEVAAKEVAAMAAVSTLRRSRSCHHHQGWSGCRSR